jgi:N-acetylmuramoyl-L-alanine amidase
MVIRDKLLTKNQFSRPGHKIIEVKAVVIHWVGKSRQTADAVKHYFESLGKQNPLDRQEDIYASAHYAIDGTNIVRMIPEDEIAYHVGGWGYSDEAIQLFGKEATSNAPRLGTTPNFYSIGIELNHLDDTGKFSAETWESAVMLTAKICREYNCNVIRHFDVTGKLCPKWFVMHVMDWDMFLNDVWEES